MMTGSTGQAIDYFRRAVKANPKLLTSKICLGISLLEKGEISEGADLLTNTLDNGKSLSGLTPKERAKRVKEHVRLGETYVELGMPMEAVQEFDRAIRIGGDYPDIRRKMAGEYIRMNLLEDAERELKRALHRNPFYEEARADLGFIYMLKGRADLASEEWSQVDPEGRGSGLVWAYRGREGGEVSEESTDDQMSVERDHSLGEEGNGL